MIAWWRDNGPACRCTCSGTRTSAHWCDECDGYTTQSSCVVAYSDADITQPADATPRMHTKLNRVQRAMAARIEKTAAATAAAVLRLGRVSQRRALPPQRFVRHPRIKRASAKG